MLITILAYHFGLFLITLLQEDISSDFSDLGRMLLGGFVLAIVLAITIALVKLRSRDKNPPTQFISIYPSREDEETKYK